MDRYVEVYRRTQDGKSIIKEGEFVLKEGETTVEFVGDPSMVHRLTSYDGTIYDRLGILNKPSDRGESKVSMADGAAFLENLPFNLWGVRIWATKVKERKTSK